ncbi:trypsin-like serine peptidase [Amycolatopsis sp. NPDC051758]|uniref:trypsin-like serine peptidase n=1 Tax=Amycolatopsis sp. NPDC051758 TaxID=3363935 RepID=UPI00379A2229
MNSTKPRRAFSRIVALLAVAGTAVVVGAAPATAADGDQVVTRVSAAERAAALAHWTPERMRQWVGDDSLPPAEKIGQVWAGPVPAGVGRLFFTAEPGVDESCTATVVPSASKDVALTAGHCVNGGLDRFDNPIRIVNVVFVPGYDHGKAPHGVFPVRAFAWSATYSGPTSGTDDDAVLALDPVGGRHVADVAGTQDVSFDRPPSPVDTTILGYPVSQLAGGEALLSCARPATLEVNSVTSAWRTDCDLAGGSSGGPWLRGFDAASGRGEIFGVTSRGTMTEDGVTQDLTSAAFTDAVKNLYEQAGKL